MSLPTDNLLEFIEDLAHLPDKPLPLSLERGKSKATIASKPRLIQLVVKVNVESTACSFEYELTCPRLGTTCRSKDRVIGGFDWSVAMRQALGYRDKIAPKSRGPIKFLVDYADKSVYPIINVEFMDEPQV